MCVHPFTQTVASQVREQRLQQVEPESHALSEVTPILVRHLCHISSEHGHLERATVITFCDRVSLKLPFNWEQALAMRKQCLQAQGLPQPCVKESGGSQSHFIFSFLPITFAMNQ